MRYTAYKVAPEDGLIRSKTFRASNGKKTNHKNFVHLVCLYTYYQMMHGADNVIKRELVTIFQQYSPVHDLTVCTNYLHYYSGHTKGSPFPKPVGLLLAIKEL
jgi:hypothetical protein